MLPSSDLPNESPVGHYAASDKPYTLPRPLSRRRSSVLDTTKSMLKSNLLDTNYSLVETYINCDYFIGLSPFRITSDSKFLTFRFPQAVFLFFNLLALFHDICQLRLLVSSYEVYKTHQKLVYVFLGYRAALAYMQFRYFQLLWWKQYKFSNLINAILLSGQQSILHTTPQKYHWKTKLLPVLVCASSVLFSCICIIGGFNQLTEASSWSLYNVICRYRDDIFVVVFGSPGTWTNSTAVPATRVNGVWTVDLWTTMSIGGFGAFVDLITELIHFCSFDVFLLATVTIWLCAKDLQIEKVSPRRKIFNQGSPPPDARKILLQHKQLGRICLEINEITKLFLPPLTTAFAVMLTYMIHLCLQRRWFMAFYVALKLSKPCIAYYIGVKITHIVEDFIFWFISAEAQAALNLDMKALHLKLSELSMMPIGMGTGVFYIDVKFITSFLGIISTYFFLIREGFGFGDG